MFVQKGEMMKIKLIFFLAVLLLLTSGCGTEYISSKDYEEMPVNFTVAFTSDMMPTEQNYSLKVLELIKSERADMVLHTGDMYVGGGAEKWDNLVNSVLGEDFPYFITSGNHEMDKSSGGWDGYFKKFNKRLSRVKGAKCVGETGVDAACTYKGLFFVLSGAGTKGYGQDQIKNIPPFLSRFSYRIGQYIGNNIINLTKWIHFSDIADGMHASYIKKQLEHSNAVWKICLWHKPNSLMQVDSHFDGPGWDVYESCREEGAFIIHGHVHQYARTFLMDDFSKQKIDSVEKNNIILEKNKSFVIDCGLGGQPTYDQDDALAANPWWAVIHTKKDGVKHGALFCIFNLDGEKDKAHCYFKNIDGEIIDQFNMTSKLE